MNIKVIVNPRAGGGKGRDIGHRAEQFLCDRGVQYSLDSTFKPGGAVSLSKKAVDDGFDLIIAVGGDGTANEIAGGIAGSKAALAVIPAGDENNFARTLGLDPSDTEAAVETALHGKTVLADAGMINGKYFLNGIRIGHWDKGNTPKAIFFGKGLSDIIRALKIIKKLDPQKLLIKTKEIELQANAAMLRIANGKYFSGGSDKVPGAAIDDGLFEVCVLNHTGKLSFLKNASKIFAGTHNRSYPVSVFRSSKIIVKGAGRVQADIDGEPVTLDLPFETSVSAEKITVKAK